MRLSLESDFLWSVCGAGVSRQNSAGNEKKLHGFEQNVIETGVCLHSSQCLQCKAYDSSSSQMFLDIEAVLKFDKLDLQLM